MASHPAQVAVIGAGVAGLSALRHLASEPDLFTPVAFELRAEVGGVWVYTEDRGVDCRGYPTHNNMYDAVICNVPKEVMCAEDFPPDPNSSSFMNRRQFHQYIQDYANNFDLSRYIKFQTRVVKVSPITTGDSLQWQMTTETADYEVPGKNLKTEIYDYVLVCTGEFSFPNTPTTPGLSKFCGRVVHSGTYRCPEDFAGEHVIVIGGGFSGSELCHLITVSAKQVYHSYRQLIYRGTGFCNDKLERIHSDVKEVREHSVIMNNGRELEVDVIFYCTGFHKAFPFLGDDCQITPDTQQSLLYKCMFHIDFPNLIFIGIRPKSTLANMMMAYRQIQYFMLVHKGNVCLPARSCMVTEIAKCKAQKPPIGLTCHQMEICKSKAEAKYVAELAQEGGFDPYPEFVIKLWEFVVSMFLNSKQQFNWFRSHQFKITPNGDTFYVVSTDC